MVKTILINVIILVIAMIALGSWCDYRAHMLAEQTASEREERDLDFWRERLLPMYRQMRIEHKENPATKADLFDPLLKSLEQLQEKTN